MRRSFFPLYSSAAASITNSTMVDENTEIDSKMERVIASGHIKPISEELKNWANPEVADFILRLDKPHQILVYRALPRDRAADVFAYFEPEDQDAFLEALTDADTRVLLADLSPDDRTAMLEELPATVTRRLMQLLSPEDLAESRQLLGYPEESVGRLMTPDYIRIRAEWTCDHALAHIRKYGRDSEIFNILYVTDGNGVLVDIVRMRRLIMLPPSTIISEILNYQFVCLSAYDDREVAVEQIQRYDVNALPVVDSEGVLVGIVTVDDIMDVAEEEATEDFHKGAAVTPLEMNYTAAAPTVLFQKRIGWLVILIFVNLLSAAVISNYQEYLQTYVALVLFMPLLIASGGNTGAQSATLMVRALSTGDLKLDGWWQALCKEVFVGLMLGLAMGGLTWLLGIYRSGMEVALVVGLSMLSIVLVANLLGVLLPFTLSKFKLDPAVASSPLITSVMDAIGLTIYFSIAVAILS
ncbi:magnesium transporter [Coraliomargarita sp. SDUM461004]|uniref:Magnesium transporter MgtE n=1 Tax=Thalassobacterium sedimentorum TaxID=3041258 RepID=A0ABU1AJC6_9BACT|nr:magnesium transporter [Coraliomargarita sp. SDUM461004]MDQ8194919.1 magnesium transporter [Coraliomargarita sp. SDUM461004]